MLEITDERTVFQDRWIVVKEKTYRKPGGAEGHWTYAERTKGQDAVIVVPVTEQSRSLVLIRQFRVPLGRDVIEFPAGLVDPGELPAATAERELLEETGYRGRLTEMGPSVPSSAGLTTETAHLAFMETGEEPEREPQHEGAEQIEVLKIRPEEIPAFLQECRRRDLLVDARAYAYLRGLLAGRG